MFVDYYSIFEVSSSASAGEIKAAFKRQALKWHPDKNLGIDTTLQMQQINEAYLILKDEEARARYDVEYLKFKEYKKEKEKKTEYKEHHKKEAPRAENKWGGYDDYEVEDDTLNSWMANAKKQAVDLAKQTIEEMRVLTKVGLKEGGKAIAEQILGYILVGLVLTLIFSLSRGCNQIKENERIEQTFKFSSALPLSLRGTGPGNTNLSGQIRIEKSTITVDACDGNQKTHDVCQIKSVKYKKKPNELEYHTNAGFFHVTLENGIIANVSLGTNDYLTLFKK